MNHRKYVIFLIVSSVLPMVGLIAAVILLWNDAVKPTDLIVFLILYIATGIGISVGYHRLLAHCSFRAKRVTRIFLVAAGAMAGQGPPLMWVAHHRRHHRLADKAGDPHSPHLNGQGAFAALRGLWHAHMGWLFDKKLKADPLRYCPDLVRDKD